MTEKKLASAPKPAHTASKVKTEVKPKAEPKAKAATKPKVAPKAKAATKPKAEAKAKAATKPTAEPKAKAAAKPTAAPKAKAAAKPTAAPKAKAATKPTAEPKAKAATKSKAEPKAKAATKPKAEPKAKAAAKPTAEPKTKAAAKLKAEPQAKISPKTNVAPKAKTGKSTLRPFGRELADIVAAAAAEHKPVDPVLLDLSGLSSIADWFFVASADNPRQMAAIAEKIIRRAREHGVRPLGHEGLGQAQANDHWILVDLGDVVIHLFNLEAREKYDLEGLWTEAPRRKVKP